MGMKIQITERFLDQIASELRQCVWCAKKGKFEQGVKYYENASQMIVTLLEESGLQEYMDEQSTARVAAESKPAKKSTRRKSKTKAGSAKGDADGGGVGDPDEAPSSDGRDS